MALVLRIILLFVLCFVPALNAAPNSIDSLVVGLQGDASEVCIKLDLPAHEWKRYVLLQQKIAALIPIEENRPTIYLRLRGRNRLNHPPDIALLGGVGPLADGYMLQSLIEKQTDSELCNVSIDLFSCPPPRKKQTLGNLLKYYRHIKSFGMSYPNCNIPFFVLSNTAHAHIRFLNHLSEHRFINLVDNIVGDIVASRECLTEILVLGTTQSFNLNLYTERFRQANIPASTPSYQHQKELQALIDKIKSGDKNVYPCLERFILEEVERQKAKNACGISPSHILLGCTELSLALKDVMVDFKQKLYRKYQIRVIDSHHEMLEDIFNEMYISRSRCTMRP